MNLRPGVAVSVKHDGSKHWGKVISINVQDQVCRVRLKTGDVIHCSVQDVSVIKKSLSFDDAVGYISKLGNRGRFNLLAALIHENYRSPNAVNGSVVKVFFTGRDIGHGVIINLTDRYADVWRVHTNRMQYFSVPWYNILVLGEVVPLKGSGPPYIVSQEIESYMNFNFRK